MRKRLMKAGLCLLTAMMLSTAGVGLVSQWSETATVQAAPVNNLTVEVDSEKGTYRLKDKNNALTTGYYYFAADVTSADVVIKKGTYYVESGYLSKSARSVEKKTVTTCSATNSPDTKYNYVIKWNGYREAVVSGKKTITSAAVYFTGKYSDGLIYLNGKVFSKGYAKVNNKLYAVSQGKTGSAYSGVFNGSYVDTAKQCVRKESNIYYKKGSLATGVVKRNYYKKGVQAFSYSGWVDLGTKRYYIKKGKALTGWQYLKSYGGGKKTYKYKFRDDGTLITDFFSEGKKYNTYIKKKMTIEINITTHTMTFYAYDSKKKSYNTPLKAVVCSTSRKKNGTPVGNFRLEKTSAKRWFIYKKANPYRYYQWAVHIKGSRSLIHSSAYYSKSANNLNVPYYNGLGTNQTTYCVRVQAVNAKLIYDISTKTNKKERVWVKVFRSNNKGAFGQVTLKDTTGKVSKKQKYDPTDPNFKKK